MAGLKCTKSSCGYSMGIPDSEVPKLRLPSALITCPRCGITQQADLAWIAYEQAQEAKRLGTAPKVTAVKQRLFAFEAAQSKINGAGLLRP